MPISEVIIYIQKFLDSDWIREMQFLGNVMHKKSNSVQTKKTGYSDWLMTKGTHRELIRFEQLVGQPQRN